MRLRLLPATSHKLIDSQIILTQGKHFVLRMAIYKLFVIRREGKKRVPDAAVGTGRLHYTGRPQRIWKIRLELEERYFEEEL